MSYVPKPLPERGKFAQLFAWLNQLRQAVIALQPQPSLNVLTTPTRHGVYREGVPKAKEGESGTMQFRGQWDSVTAYTSGDFVICDLTGELDDGAQAGFYQAINDVTGGTHPSVNTTDWRLAARGNWGKISFRTPGGAGKVIIDTNTTSLKMYGDAAAPANGSIELILSEIPVDGTNKVLKIHRDSFCYGLTEKYITWIRSEPDDLPE